MGMTMAQDGSIVFEERARVDVWKLTLPSHHRQLLLAEEEAKGKQPMLC